MTKRCDLQKGIRNGCRNVYQRQGVKTGAIAHATAPTFIIYLVVYVRPNLIVYIGSLALILEHLA